jgi:hypothetical protein
MPHVMLGNTSAIAVITDPETGQKTRYRWANVVRTTDQCTIVEPDLLGQMTDVRNLFRDRSDQPPAWVESDDEALTTALRAQYGCGGRPDDWTDEVTGAPNMVLIEEAPALPVATEEVSPDLKGK